MFWGEHGQEIRNECGQSGHETLKITVSEE